LIIIALFQIARRKEPGAKTKDKRITTENRLKCTVDLPDGRQAVDRRPWTIFRDQVKTRLYSKLYPDRVSLLVRADFYLTGISDWSSVLLRLPEKDHTMSS